VVTLSLICVPTTPALAQPTKPALAESAEPAWVVAGGPAAEAAQAALAKAKAAADVANNTYTTAASVAAKTGATASEIAAARAVEAEAPPKKVQSDAAGATAATKAAAARAAEAAAAAAVPDVQEFTQNPAEVDDGVDEIADDPTPVDGAPLAGNATSFAVATRDKWADVKKPWKVTHATGYENYTGGTGTYTKTAAYQTQLDATATAETEAGIVAHAFIGKLSGKVKFSLALSGHKTESGGEKVTATMSPNHTFVFYAGDRRPTASYKHWEQLPSTGLWTLIWTSLIRSYGLYREGAVKCGSSPSKSTLGYVVNRDYC
jgi:hypothetical protein